MLDPKENPDRTWPSKHAWRNIARELPPKRGVAERICDFDEIYGLYDEATARAQASRCIDCPDPPCAQACPLGNRIPVWLALVADGRFLEAAEVSRSTSNMPEICGRVCPQERLCEGACILNARSEPVAIGAVEKFLNEYAFAHHAVQAEFDQNKPVLLEVALTEIECLVAAADQRRAADDRHPAFG